MVQRAAGLAFPIGTLAVNVSGSFIAGFLLRYFMNVQTHPSLRAALIVGFCGGFTTFSALSVETLRMLESGQWQRATLYIALTLVLGIGAALAGLRLAPGAA